MNIAEGVAKAMHSQCQNRYHAWIKHLPLARLITAQIEPLIARRVHLLAVTQAAEVSESDRTRQGQAIRALTDEAQQLRSQLAERDGLIETLGKNVAALQTSRKHTAKALEQMSG